MTPKQALVAHLTYTHGVARPRGTHKQLTIDHRHLHDVVLTHTHEQPEGWVTGDWKRQVRIVLIKPKNPSSTKAEDRNWTLQVAGHEKACIIQFVRLYSTYYNDDTGARRAAESWLGYMPKWIETRGGGWEVVGV
jgi:hypothetical protein